ncbi:MAG: PAS domain-containing sensor histidine kinase [Chlorobi bacterium]|nr:PAS domain-containing sensor histidine kinase [Chlorobiota bacterium]
MPETRINDIVEQIKQMVVGNFNVKVAISDTGDEMDRITTELNKLAKSLSNKTRENVLHDKLNILLDGIIAISSYDFNHKLPLIDSSDIYNDIATRLNILSDKFQHSIISNDYFNNIIHNIDDLYIVTDLKFTIEMVNQSVLNILKYEELELTGVSIKEIISPISFDNLELEKILKLTQHISKSKQEIIFITKTGEAIQISFTVQILPYYNNNVKKIIYIGHVKETNKKIQIANDLYKNIIKESPIGISIYNSSGQCIHANSASAIIIGATQEQVLEQNYNQINSWKKTGLIDIAKKAITHKKRQFHEFAITTTFGKKVYLKSYFIPLQLEDEIFLLLMIEDITKRKQAEKALKESENRLKIFMNESPDSYILLNSELKLIFVNNTALRVFNKTQKELFGKSILDISPSVKESGRFNQYKEVLKTGKSLLIEEVFLNATVGNIYLEVRVFKSGNDLGIIGTNITERKHAEEKINNNARKFHEFMESSIDAFSLFDSDLNLIDMNEASLNMFFQGMNKKNIIGKNILDFDPSIKKNGVWDNLMKVIKTGEPFINENHILHSKWGNLFLVVKTFKMGEGLGIIASNITKIKLAEKEILQQNEEIRATNEELQTTTDALQNVNAELQESLKREKELGKLKTRFVSLASHEFRTPLTIINSAAEIIINYFDKLSKNDIKKRLFEIQGEINSMTRTIEDVLIIGKSDSYKFDYMPAIENIVELCRNICEDFKIREKEQHNIIFETYITNQNLNVDKKWIRHTFENLFSNALKFSEKGSTVSMKINRKKNNILIAIQDEGIGIPKADLKYLFEPFYRGKNVEYIHGTGLGLSIVKNAVELNGGYIKVESKEFIGSTFNVYFPITNKKI